MNNRDNKETPTPEELQNRSLQDLKDNNLLGAGQEDEDNKDAKNK